MPFSHYNVISSLTEDTEVVVVAVGVVATADDRLHHTIDVDIHVRDLVLTLRAVSTITGQIATRPKLTAAIVNIVCKVALFKISKYTFFERIFYV